MSRLSREEYLLIWQKACAVKQLGKPAQVDDTSWNKLQNFEIIQDFVRSCNDGNFAVNKTRQECVDYLKGVNTTLLSISPVPHGLVVYTNFISNLISYIAGGQLDTDLQAMQAGQTPHATAAASSSSHQNDEAQRLVSAINFQLQQTTDNKITASERTFLQDLVQLLENRHKQDVNLRREISTLVEAKRKEFNGQFTSKTKSLVDEALRLYPAYSREEDIQMRRQADTAFRNMVAELQDEIDKKREEVSKQAHENIKNKTYPFYKARCELVENTLLILVSFVKQSSFGALAQDLYPELVKSLRDEFYSNLPPGQPSVKPFFSEPRNADILVLFLKTNALLRLGFEEDVNTNAPESASSGAATTGEPNPTYLRAVAFAVYEKYSDDHRYGMKSLTTNNWLKALKNFSEGERTVFPSNGSEAGGDLQNLMRACTGKTLDEFADMTRKNPQSRAAQQGEEFDFADISATTTVVSQGAGSAASNGAPSTQQPRNQEGAAYSLYVPFRSFDRYRDQESIENDAKNQAKKILRGMLHVMDPNNPDQKFGVVFSASLKQTKEIEIWQRGANKGSPPRMEGGNQALVMQKIVDCLQSDEEFSKLRGRVELLPITTTSFNEKQGYYELDKDYHNSTAHFNQVTKDLDVISNFKQRGGTVILPVNQQGREKPSPKTKRVEIAEPVSGSFLSSFEIHNYAVGSNRFPLSEQLTTLIQRRLFTLANRNPAPTSHRQNENNAFAPQTGSPRFTSNMAAANSGTPSTQQPVNQGAAYSLYVEFGILTDQTADARRQAEEILTGMLQVMDTNNPHQKFGVVYSANLSQTKEIEKWRNDSGNDKTFPPTMEGVNQAAVMREMVWLMQHDSKYVELQGRVEILPITTVKYKQDPVRRGDNYIQDEDYKTNGQQLQQISKDLSVISNFKQHGGVVIQLVNQTGFGPNAQKPPVSGTFLSASNEYSYGVGGGTTTLSPQLNQMVQEALHDFAQSTPTPTLRPTDQCYPKNRV